MTNTKNTKRALLVSVLSLVLCFAMLLGSTFAWFTDSAASGSNVIKSGNLDIVVEYTLDGENWNNLDGADDLFQKGLWEPGHTEAVALRIKNNGSLALKYTANMNIVKENIGKTKDGKDIVLSDILTVGTLIQQVNQVGEIAVGLAFELENMYKGTTAFKAANVLSKDQELLAGDAHYVIIKVDMDETIGNEANHNGTDIPEIEFGINVFATQFTKESDSFGNQYDDLAGETHFMMNGKNYFSFDDAVANATPDANGVVEYFIGGEAVFSGGWDAPIAPAGAKKVVIKGTGANTSTLNLAHTYRNQLCATGMIVEISDITIECDPCGTHQDQRNIWVNADELYATNVVFKDPADASKVKVAVFDGCTFASATADEEPSGGNYQLWVGDHDANYGATTESVTVKNCVFESGRRAIKLAPTTGSTSYVALIEGNTFNNITYKPAVCLNYGAQANTVTITNNKLINTALVEDEVNGNYTESNNTVEVYKVNSAEEIIGAVNSETIEISEDIVYNNTDPSKQMILESNNEITVNGNGSTITNQGADPANGNHGYVAFIPPAGEDVTVSDLTVTGKGFVEMGDYSAKGGNYVANNLVVKDLASTLAIGDKGFVLACGFSHYGNATLNNCTMTGTTAMVEGAMAVDAGFVNGTTTVVNGGEYGTIYCWSKAVVTFNNANVDSIYVAPTASGKITIAAGTHIATLNIAPGTLAASYLKTENIIIENGATVDAIVYGDTTYTLTEWLAR